jgi:hypothetical protein
VRQDPAALRYRLELEGELSGEWAAWFGDAEVRCHEGRTVLELTVPDQAALHGVLRRVHDLHLRLVALNRIDDR